MDKLYITVHCYSHVWRMGLHHPTFPKRLLYVRITATQARAMIKAFDLKEGPSELGEAYFPDAQNLGT